MIVTKDSTTAPLDHGCAVRYPVRVVSAASGVNGNDYALLANSTGAAFAITLPSAAAHPGRVLAIKKTDASANAVTITPAGGDSVDTASLATQNKYAVLISDGVSAWKTIANN